MMITTAGLLHQSSYLVVDCHAAWETTDNSCNVTAPIFVQSQMQLSWMWTEALFETQDELVLVVSSGIGMIMATGFLKSFRLRYKPSSRTIGP